jgi:hypothetical protein
VGIKIQYPDCRVDWQVSEQGMRDIDFSQQMIETYLLL